jgi:hypothetical protein
MKKTKSELLTIEYDKVISLINTFEAMDNAKAQSGHYNVYKDIYAKLYSEGKITNIKYGIKEMSKGLFEFTNEVESLIYREKFFEEYFKLTSRKCVDDFGSVKNIIKNIIRRKKIRNEDEYRDITDFISDNPEEAEPFLETLNELLNNYNP